MINSIDTPKLIYPVIVLEIVPELPDINDTNPIQPGNRSEIRTNKSE